MPRHRISGAHYIILHYTVLLYSIICVYTYDYKYDYIYDYEYAYIYIYIYICTHNSAQELTLTCGETALRLQVTIPTVPICYYLATPQPRERA